MNTTSWKCAIGAVTFACAAIALASRAGADIGTAVIAQPTVQQFSVWKDTAGSGVFNPETDAVLRDSQGNAVCITNMLQWLSAGTSYGYKQYDNVKGADLSAWPNSSDGTLTGQTNKTWLTPQTNPSQIVNHTTGVDPWQPGALQFWLGWSRLDHDPGTAGDFNTSFATDARGFNLGIIMNQEQRYWDPVLNKVVHVPDSGIPQNTVKLDIAVTGSSLTAIPGETITTVDNTKPRVILSDGHSSNVADYYTPPSNLELPRPPAPTALDPYPSKPGQELVANGTVPTGYDYNFNGTWTYDTNTTDGGVIGNLRPNPTAGNLVIRITLDQLYDPNGVTDPNDPNYKGIKEIVFYSFKDSGTYDPLDPASYDASNYTRYVINVGDAGLKAGDTIFITDYIGGNCCDPVPEPVTLVLLAGGGVGVAGLGWRHRRRKVA